MTLERESARNLEIWVLERGKCLGSPICFGDFDVPCKTNCGHWYCASCILMLWNYSTARQCCKCPICSHLISKLTPEASLTLRREKEIVEALNKLQRYNCLFVGGARGFIMKVYQLPLLFWRLFGGLTSPERFRFNYYTASIIALLLTVTLSMSSGALTSFQQPHEHIYLKEK